MSALQGQYGHEVATEADEGPSEDSKPRLPEGREEPRKRSLLEDGALNVPTGQHVSRQILAYHLGSSGTKSVRQAGFGARSLRDSIAVSRLAGSVLCDFLAAVIAPSPAPMPCLHSYHIGLTMGGAA